jgi:hypothetical protein
VRTTTGMFHDQAAVLEGGTDAGPVAIVADDLDQVSAYLELGGKVSPYVVVLTAADVPPRIGGMALLMAGPVPADLRDALTAAAL